MQWLRSLGWHWRSQSWCQAGARGRGTCWGSSQSRAPCCPRQSRRGSRTWMNFILNKGKSGRLKRTWGRSSQPGSQRWAPTRWQPPLKHEKVKEENQLKLERGKLSMNWKRRTWKEKNQPRILIQLKSGRSRMPPFINSFGGFLFIFREPVSSSFSFFLSISLRSSSIPFPSPTFWLSLFIVFSFQLFTPWKTRSDWKISLDSSAIGFLITDEMYFCFFFKDDLSQYELDFPNHSLSFFWKWVENKEGGRV